MEENKRISVERSSRPDIEEFISTVEMAKIIGVTRDTLLKYTYIVTRGDRSNPQWKSLRDMPLPRKNYRTLEWDWLLVEEWHLNRRNKRKR
jgi:hypothetical protein